MNIRPELRKYQETACDQISSALLSMLGKDDSDNRLLVFKSPTGSGKTITVAHALSATFAHPNRHDFVVLWLSTGKGGLHRQSARALEYFLQDSAMKVRVLDSREDIESNPSPTSGSILVVNWEKLFKESDGDFTGVMLRQGETANFFTMLKNITLSGKDMIAVIDESHLGLKGEQTMKLVNELRKHRPFIQIEMSATPTTSTDAELRLEGLHHDVVVPFAKVEEDGMVRRSVLLNPDFSNVQKKYSKKSLDLQVLHGAWDKVVSLRTAFDAVGSPVRPLLLIQYPDGDRAVDRAEVVEKFLASVGLRENGTYAKYLSGDHSRDLENISRDDSPYEALIFKQAIAVGWDCPRAQVLVQFRKPGSRTFKIQTLGRIMRSPEQKHYDDEELNVAYVYSDIEGIDVDIVPDDQDPDFKVRNRVVRRGTNYPVSGLKLRSVFQPRKRDLHYPLRENLEPELHEALDEYVKPVLPIDPLKSTAINFMQNGRAEASDLLGRGEGQFTGVLGEGRMGIEIAQAYFDRVLTEDIGPYSSREQSRNRIKAVLINWLVAKRSDWNPENVQHFVIQNQDQVVRAIAQACQKCAGLENTKAVAAARARKRVNEAWEVPVSDLVSEETHEESTHGNIMDPPFVEKRRSNPESRFEEWLGVQCDNKKIIWWWKNGERDEKYLGIEFDFESQTERTYPDYLVFSASKILWAIEVKDVDDPEGAVGGRTHAKALGLQQWAKEHSVRRNKNKELFDIPEVKTGVVIPIRNGQRVMPFLADATNWCQPTEANLAAKSGWGNLTF